MNKLARVLGLTFILLLIAAPAAWPKTVPQGPRQQAQEKEGVLVGRISHVEGELLRYVPEQKDWVVAVNDSPFGLEDALYSGNDGKAEFLMPNSTWIRIGANTQVQMIALKGDATEIDVASGMARFVDRSSQAVIKATTPFGYVVAEPGSAFDLYVGDESVEVIGIQGKVDFIHDVDGAKYEVVSGAMSVLADNRQATAGEGKVDTEWDEWNNSRDTLLARNIETRGESVNYLPEGIREDSKVLDENGRWEKVYYEGQYRQVWRPTHVEADWAPYTVGRWTEWYGDQCWVPAEPFGYVTHHYGYWFSANNYWYWSPPIVSVGIGSPYAGIGFGWYPGRVGWLYSGVNVGWWPLLPWEPFYAHRWWGPWGFHHYGGVNININRYRYANRAVFVNHGNFYGVNNYHGVRVTNVNRAAIGSQYHASPVLHNTVLHNAGNANQRYSFTNANPSSRPNQAVTARVAQNQAKFSQTASSVNGRAIRQQASATTMSHTSAGGVSTPKVTSKFSGGASGAGRSHAFSGSSQAVSRASRAASGRAHLNTDGRSGNRTASIRSKSLKTGVGQATAKSAQSKVSKSSGNYKTYSNSGGYHKKASSSYSHSSLSKGSNLSKGNLSGRQRGSRDQYRSAGSRGYDRGARSAASGYRGGRAQGASSMGLHGRAGGASHGSAAHAFQGQGGHHNMK
jgi:hypothetical protein